MNVLVIDVGGTHVKILATGQETHREFESGLSMTAQKMVSQVLEAAKDWTWQAVSIGYPGPVLRGRPVAEPHNLGRGWVGFDFRKAFGRPTQLMNDAAMQAIGSYEGGRMLFLGLGTGLGSALVVDGTEAIVLSDARDAQTLAQRIRQLYAREEFRCQMGQAASQKAREWTWDRNAAQVWDLLESALRKK